MAAYFITKYTYDPVDNVILVAWEKVISDGTDSVMAGSGFTVVDDPVLTAQWAQLLPPVTAAAAAASSLPLKPATVTTSLAVQAARVARSSTAKRRGH